jgi:sortase A
MRRILERLLWAGGLVALALFAAPWVEARWYEATAGRMLDHASEGGDRVAAVGPDTLIGRLEIPRLGVSALVEEGQEESTLRRAIGHIPGTGLPGRVGNVGLAAHRDTFFRPLRRLRKGDLVRLTTLAGPHEYTVESIRVVSPERVDVLDARAGREILTLVTCYPFDFIGAAPERYVVRAEKRLS